MIEVIGIKFKSGGKMYYFAPNDLNPAEGSYVVVETARGLECGKVAARRHGVSEESITVPLKPILRLATEADMEILRKNQEYIEEAFKFCDERIKARELPMRLVDVECGFDSNKLIFYFTADSRVDFRELVKDLALAYHVRIELRQIGDRDEAKLLGGLGICGREFCCKGYLNSFQPISIKMAKEQGLALNPSKISGTCGRLMCCLRYESPVYEELIKMTPRVGATVMLPGDPPVRAYVMEVNLVTGNLRVKPENSDMPITVSRDQVGQLQDHSKRMTKDDIKDKRKQIAQAAAAASKQQSTQQKPATEQSGKPHAPKQKPVQQVAAPVGQQTPQQHNRPAQKQNPPSALHPEFGEKQQRTQQPKPATPPATKPLADMDFTEHRAVVEHPERAANAAGKQEGHPNQRQGNPRNQNRRFNHYNRNRRPRTDGQKNNHGGGESSGT